MNFLYKQVLCVTIVSACTCAFADSGVLPSWMRRFSAPTENSSNEKVITREVVKEVVVKQLPPEIIDLKIESKESGPDVIVSGQVKAHSSIHAVLINGQSVVHNAGYFNVSRQLVPGNNEFIITAIDSRGLETKLKTSQVYFATNTKTSEGQSLQPSKLRKPSE